MRLSLIGMSSVGKSFCAKNLATHHGYRRIDCDALIEKKLAETLEPLGLRGVEGMARWMGFPSDPGYAEKSRRYLDLERTVMRDVLDSLSQNKEKSPLVVDTTGSVIYLGDDILNGLREKTRVIYFEASEEQKNQLFRSYSSVRPKPVIWDEAYAPRPDETAQQAMARGYADLLRTRAERYKALAHLIIPTRDLADHWNHIGSFILQQIEAA
ncbi:MAG: hypothetical protein PHS57_02855 [Alphaproteobacteria bacterium]|nr:hypothetical protein [Alphaproteobacteria bacterium]